MAQYAEPKEDFFNQASLASLFDFWLGKNRHLFEIAPKLITPSESGYTYDLQLPSAVVDLYVGHEYTFTVNAYHNKKHWDIIFEADVFAAQNENGEWYCTECLEGFVKYFPTKYNLYVDHSFRAFKEWYDAVGGHEMELIFHSRGGATWVEVHKQ